MKELMLVWGKGTRICLGQNMATMEMKILVSRVIDKFTVKLASEQTHDDMVMTDHFTLIPKGLKCPLVFGVAE